MHRMNHGVEANISRILSVNANFAQSFVFHSTPKSHTNLSGLQNGRRTDCFCFDQLHFMTQAMRASEEWRNFRGHSFNIRPATDRQCAKQQHQHRSDVSGGRQQRRLAAHDAKKKLSRRFAIHAQLVRNRIAKDAAIHQPSRLSFACRRVKKFVH